MKENRKEERKKLIDGFIEDVECFNLDSKKVFRNALNVLADNIENLAEQRFKKELLRARNSRDINLNDCKILQKEISRLKESLKAHEKLCGEKLNEIDRLTEQLKAKEKEIEELKRRAENCCKEAQKEASGGELNG